MGVAEIVPAHYGMPHPALREAGQQAQGQTSDCMGKLYSHSGIFPSGQLKILPPSLALVL